VTVGAPLPALRVGSRTRRRRGDVFLSGRATYVADIDLPLMAHVAILRSPHPHARIRSVDTAAAAKAPDVLAVVDGRHAARLAEPLPHFVDPETFGGRTLDVRCLALDEVTYAGQPVVAVVAESVHAAEAALALVKVDYEPLPFVLDAEAALATDAPRAVESWDTNVIMAGAYEEGDVDGLLAAAPHRLADELRIQRYSQQPMETRGYVATWDGRAQRMTLHGSCQNPHPLRTILATCLGLEEEQVRVVVPDVGGAFGLKMHGHPEEPLVCVLSRLIGRPVRWIERRDECLLVGAREQLHRFAVGFDDDGRVLALRDEAIANVGALGAAPGWGMAYLTALTFPTGYRIEACAARFQVVATNKSPWNAARGYGKEATNLVMERVMDLVARRLGRDPADIRRTNLIRSDEFPYKTTGGLNIDSGDYHQALDRALALIDEPAVRSRQAAQPFDVTRRIGLGLAFELTPEAGGTPGTLVGGFDTSTVRVAPSGRVTVLTGVTTPGGGNDTGITQIVADRLGIEPDAIAVVQGDTDLCPYGFGNFSGRSMVVGGSAAALAADDVAAKLRVVAGALLGVDPGRITLAGGQAQGPDGALPLAAVARAAYTDAFGVTAAVELPLESTRVYKPDNLSFIPDAKGRAQTYPTYSYAVHAALVDVDVETGVVALRRYGVVHDCGTVINPTLVEGQMHGAVAMGIGGALMEHVVFEDDGQLQTDRLKRYLMPRAGDLPEIEIEHMVTPSPFTLLGAKGAGEAGVGGAASALLNAVDDALAPLGVELKELPLTPPRVLRAILAAGA
jgi:carbon-monoxide dehydrogenase large subunit